MRWSRAGLAAALSAAAMAFAATGCGGDDDAGSPPVALGGPAIDQDIALVNCEDWEKASVEERLGTLAQIENFIRGPVGEGAGTGQTLESDQAYDLMEGFCREKYASSFRLYKLYTRAAAFSGVELPENP